MTPFDFDEIVDAEIPGEERDRLRRTHELLLAAGPPPELTPALAAGPLAAPTANVTPLTRGIPRRRLAAAVVLAATLALASFGLGYLAAGDGEFEAERIVKMHGTEAAPGALASLKLAPRDEAGNWPMELVVQGLKEQPRGEYYELWLARNGKPVVSCGTFRVHEGRTVVPLNAPYSLRRFDSWIVTEHATEGESDVILMTT